MQIKTFPMGKMGANCYLLTDDEGNAVLIDPGAVSSALFEALAGKKLRYILLTHGHFDHILGVAECKRRTGAEVCIGEKDAPMLSDASLSLAQEHSLQRQEPLTPDRLLYDGDVIDFAGGIRVMETPGHTPGGVCFLWNDTIFTGDTLFCRTVGRTDFPGGSAAQLRQSVQTLLALEGDKTVYPGHDEPTTLSHERKFNPFAK